MPTTVEAGFTTFHARLTPSSSETGSAAAHRQSIEKCLKSTYEITNFFRTGSFGHGTSIRRFSDVDYFAVTPTSRLPANSNTILTGYRQALDARFPRTGVTVRSPAVLIPFGTDAAESTEVIPADYVGTTTSGRRIYDIPDRSGGWMRASPAAHNDYVDRIDKKLGAKAKPLMRFVKAWKFNRNVPVSSFCLELRVARYLESENSVIYSVDFRNFLKHLHDIGLAKIQDPLGVSGMISGFATKAQVDDTLSKLGTALTRANNACEAERSGNLRLAFQWWDVLFDGHFPAFG